MKIAKSPHKQGQQREMKVRTAPDNLKGYTRHSCAAPQGTSSPALLGGGRKK